MTRIALIAGTYAPDRCGVADYTNWLRTALQTQIETIVLTTIDAAQSANDSSVLGVVHDWNLRNLPLLVQAIQHTKADILHIQHAAGTYGFDRAIFLLPLLLKLSGWRNPIVTTIHEYGWWEWQPKWISQQFLESVKQWGQQRYWWDREDGFLITGSNAIITTNSEAENAILDRLPNLKFLLHRIPIGANIEVAECDRPAAREKLLQNCNWNGDVSAIAFFGFLHPVKGLETLLTAFQKVNQIESQTRLILIGGVESLALRGSDAKQYWNKLKQLISDLHLDDKVHMTGYVEPNQASYYLFGSDLGVLPFNHGVTLKSGSLLALMAHQLPVIATRSNDSDLDSGLVKQIPARDPNALTEALLDLLQNPTERDRLATSGYAFVQQFSWSTIAEAHLAVYDSVMSNA